jgi:mono/diheme cytochrome c family protein
LPAGDLQRPRIMAIFPRAVVGLAAAALAAGAAVAAAQDAPRTGRQVYEAACASCHGADGRGVTAAAAEYPLPRPDFTDCNFATREPDLDWLAVGHAGGPARGFNRLMPAYGEALPREEIERSIAHIRTFCTSGAWPRGELNLPKPLFTEKAFPEDEYVVTLVAGEGSVTNKIVYERRIAARNQIEVVVPVALADRGAGDWTGGIGDVAFAFKRVLSHGLRRGTILSASAELVLPTGSTERGIGGGTAVLEPFVTVGQILPASLFVHAQAGGGFPFDRAVADEAFWRTAIGRKFIKGEFGRMWSPMIEILGSREMAAGARTHWDIAPQMQVTLSARQHIMANAGVRIPVNARTGRSKQFVMYFLWDWFDGDLVTGW